MSLQETLRLNMRKSTDAEIKTAMKTILGDFDRVNDGKAIEDDAAIKILKKLKKSEEELLQYKGATNSTFLEVVNDFLSMYSKEVTEEDILSAISEIDFSKFKNKMQAMSILMKKFGSNVDGNLVKKLLMES